MTGRRVGLGLDGGGSSSRWLLLASEGEVPAEVLGEGRTGPLTGHLFEGDDVQLERLRMLLTDAAAVQKPDALVAGLTGLHPKTKAFELYTKTVAETLELGPECILLADDMRIAYASAFGPGEGVLVYAGTGSIAYHRTAAGDVLRTGGYGYLIDDAGGGYWLGREGLRAVLRQYDTLGLPSQTHLANMLYAKLGSRDWDELMPLIYSGGRTFIASLAPALAEAAEVGDEDAQRILWAGGLELARLATGLFGRLGGVLPVAFAGGISQLSPVLTEALEQTLGGPVQRELEDPVWAAARWALELAQTTR